jgi:hypothetical protein
MSTSHADDLRKIREVLVQSRRHLVEEALRVAPENPSMVIHTWLKNIIVRQDEIEAIDRAILDEENLGGDRNA